MTARRIALTWPGGWACALLIVGARGAHAMDVETGGNAAEEAAEDGSPEAWAAPGHAWREAVVREWSAFGAFLEEWTAAVAVQTLVDLEIGSAARNEPSTRDVLPAPPVWEVVAEMAGRLEEYERRRVANQAELERLGQQWWKARQDLVKRAAELFGPLESVKDTDLDVAYRAWVEALRATACIHDVDQSFEAVRVAQNVVGARIGALPGSDRLARSLWRMEDLFADTTAVRADCQRLIDADARINREWDSRREEIERIRAHLARSPGQRLEELYAAHKTVVDAAPLVHARRQAALLALRTDRLLLQARDGFDLQVSSDEWCWLTVASGVAGHLAAVGGTVQEDNLVVAAGAMNGACQSVVDPLLAVPGVDAAWTQALEAATRSGPVPITLPTGLWTIDGVPMEVRPTGGHATATAWVRPTEHRIEAFDPHLGGVVASAVFTPTAESAWYVSRTENLLHFDPLPLGRAFPQWPPWSPPRSESGDGPSRPNPWKRPTVALGVGMLGAGVALDGLGIVEILRGRQVLGAAAVRIAERDGLRLIGAGTALAALGTPMVVIPLRAARPRPEEP